MKGFVGQLANLTKLSRSKELATRSFFRHTYHNYRAKWSIHLSSERYKVWKSPDSEAFFYAFEPKDRLSQLNWIASLKICFYSDKLDIFWIFVSLCKSQTFYDCFCLGRLYYFYQNHLDGFVMAAEADSTDYKKYRSGSREYYSFIVEAIIFQ